MKIFNQLFSSHKIVHPFKNLTPIIADGGMSMPIFGDGRLIPALVLDCDNNKEALNFFFLDEDNSLPGDVRSTWAKSRISSDYVYLILDFLRPVVTQIVVPFELIKQGGLVDGIIRSRGVYLQPKEVGLTVSEGFGKEQKLIEIPATTTFPHWDAVYRSRMYKFYKAKGASKEEAKVAAELHIQRIREVWKLRQL